jgi:hypothetical protein
VLTEKYGRVDGQISCERAQERQDKSESRGVCSWLELTTHADAPERGKRRECDVIRRCASDCCEDTQYEQRGVERYSKRPGTRRQFPSFYLDHKYGYHGDMRRRTVCPIRRLLTPTQQRQRGGQDFAQA